MADVDTILGKLGDWQRQQLDVNKKAGTIRQEKGQFADDNDLSKDFMAFATKFHKMREQNRNDFLRNFDDYFDGMRAHYEGQSTPDMLDGAEVVPDEETPDPE